MAVKAKGKAEAAAEKLLTYEGVAEILGVEVRTVFRYVASGKLKARRLAGRTVRFRREDVDRFIDRG